LLSLVRIKRFPYTEGVLILDGTRFCETVENSGALYGPGPYWLKLTPSDRAKAGTLWTPDPDKRLLPQVCDDDNTPLVIDSGRSGIRFHAGNDWSQSAGCTIVALGRGEPGRVWDSRPALTRLYQLLDRGPQRLVLA
jgi:uncharacterized protein DUF5675